ncbi:MAG: hypothetical protein LBQ83_08160 [Candidatus Margulisbacteria bacterium]|jgi:hypothetical protein|nr:hypothetical protein [Candidatus Margulisiibacteriota bacterium]
MVTVKLLVAVKSFITDNEKLPRPISKPANEMTSAEKREHSLYTKLYYINKAIKTDNGYLDTFDFAPEEKQELLDILAVIFRNPSQLLMRLQQR